MEARNTRTAANPLGIHDLASQTISRNLTDQRLDILLAANAEVAERKAMYGSERERLEAFMMRSPMTPEQTFAYLGFMLGAFPPLAIFIRVLTGGASLEGLVLFFMIAINVVSALAGYFFGKVVARMVRRIEKRSWSVMLLILPFVGLLWGMVAGGAGAFIVFIVGAIFGAMIGGAVGAIALPVFVVFHRLLKRGDMIERRHFLPLAFGLTFTICSFILGL